MSESQSPPGYSRREFLKDTSTLLGTIPLAGALTGCADNGSFEVTDELPEHTSQSMAAQAATPVTSLAITLTVNGQNLNTTVEPRATLNEVLRYQLGLTGTKLGCDRAACGACTVHLDGKAVYSCTTLAIEAAGRSVTTIEGLAVGGVLDPVQDCFVEYDALQCGFCTPGMVMSCKALLNTNLNATESDVQAATAGNLCRCGTYPRVFQATLAAAARLKGG
ncbi:MAG: (2Fe-2S)-binding protein [Myxococcota bacterium]